MVMDVSKFESGYVLFAMNYGQENDIEYAKEYCRDGGLTPNEVSIKIVGKKDKMLLVTVK